MSLLFRLTLFQEPHGGRLRQRPFLHTSWDTTHFLGHYRFLRGIVEGMLQQMLEAEITEHLGAAPHQRTENRKGYRNGYKPRKLKSRVGTLDLLVPQDREGTFSTQLFARYQSATRRRSLWR
nr:transposase [Rubrobacter xylanophilus]